MKFEEILKNLEHLTLHQLWRLASASLNLVEDERFIKPLRNSLKPGMTISYFNPYENRYINAVVVAVHRTLVSVLTEERKAIRITMCAINLEGIVIEPEIKTKTTPLTKANLKVGDIVGYHNTRDGNDYFGKIIKLNPKNARMKLNSGEVWDVPYKILFSVVDANCKQTEEKLIEGTILETI